MRRTCLLAGAVALSMVAAAPVRAQLFVSDPLTETNTLQSLGRGGEAAGKRVEMINNQIIQIEHLRNTLLAVSHGNVAAWAIWWPELGGSA